MYRAKRANPDAVFQRANVMHALLACVHTLAPNRLATLRATVMLLVQLHLPSFPSIFVRLKRSKNYINMKMIAEHVRVRAPVHVARAERVASI